MDTLSSIGLLLPTYLSHDLRVSDESDVSASLESEYDPRLRYEISRQFVPYTDGYWQRVLDVLA